MFAATSTDKAPAAIGPYSQAIRYGNVLYTSGQIPLNPATGEVSGKTMAEQAEMAIRNLLAVLEANGMGFENIMKTTCFITDMAEFGAFNEVYAKHFVSKPARSCVEVSKLPKGVLCEIEAIAAK
ncbi:conserved hypothetical protein [uncultured delta proteobacterium]|uniref:RidA family protein n=1 Tax=uncultured delta proteobacterium TaxID=34034 RepID=A0A212IYG0_9DELT|nr:conserved hypothetical protein [uncultured delta proteobacterium]